MKALVGTFNQEKALVGAFSVIVKLHEISGNHRWKFYCIPLPDAAAALPAPATTRQMSNLADVGPELRAETGVGFHLTLGQHIMKQFLVILPALLGIT